MKYTAPDGTVLETKTYPEETTYTCPCENCVDGKYESTETTGAATPIGIKQMKITRLVENEEVTIIIRESNEQELQTYIDSIITA